MRGSQYKMKEEMKDCIWSLDFQIYCNYPEISKTVKTCICSEVSSSITSIASSSVLPSLNSDVSDLSSQPNIFYGKKYSPSICNYFKYSLPCEKSTSFDDNVYVENYLDWNSKRELESEKSFTSSSFEESVVWKKSVSKILLSIPHLEEWLKKATDQDPWNAEHLNLTVEDKIPSCASILSHQLISTCSSQIDQLPDTKSFVLTRLHIQKQGLEDISILTEYKYFEYVDISWNFISDLKALNSLNYLMYLNASHNKLSTVLDLWPPWFLTYVDLSCNEIKDIGQNLSNFWSLRHINLSYNLIEKIEGLGELRYLRYLNLSHNHIKRIENLDCFNIEELNLEFNEISDCDLEGTCLQALKQIKILTLGHNKMSCLLPFEQLYSLNKLDIHHNCLTNLHEISCLAGLSKLYEVNLSENVVCSTCSYREFIIFKIPSLRLLDSIPISSSEQVAAKMLFGPDLFTSIQHLRTKIELWNQLAPREIGSETMPLDDLPVPLVIFVGTFLNNKEEIATNLLLKFPNQIYRFKKYTTIPSSKNYEPNNMVSVSVDQFNIMIKTGKFFFYYKEVGFFFGVLRDELCTCILDSRIGMTEMPLEAAMVLRLSGLYPLMILTFVDDEEKYSNKLRYYYMNLELMNFQSPTCLGECQSMDQKNHDSKSELFILNEKKRLCQEQMDSLSFANTELTTHTISNNTTMDNFGEFTKKISEDKSSTFDKSVTWKLSKNEIETDSEDSLRTRTSQILNPSASSDERKSEFDEEDEILAHTFEAETFKEDQNFDQSSNKKIYKIKLEKFYKNKLYKDSIDCSESQSESSESISIIVDETKSNKSNDDFEWIWTYESSRTTESEPDENCLNMVKGREKFVRNTFLQQDLYIEANQLQPALFVATVPADDIQSALSQIEKACCKILKSRQNYKNFEDLTNEPKCSKLIEEKLSSIMNDFYNIPTNVKF